MKRFPEAKNLHALKAICCSGFRRRISEHEECASILLAAKLLAACWMIFQYGEFSSSDFYETKLSKSSMDDH